MDHIGIDVHKRDSQVYILAEGGEVVEQRIRTEPARFAAVLGDRRPPTPEPLLPITCPLAAPFREHSDRDVLPPR